MIAALCVLAGMVGVLAAGVVKMHLNNLDRIARIEDDHVGTYERLTNLEDAVDTIKSDEWWNRHERHRGSRK